ncbi:MAG: tetratricopeptide repeat protein [Desulfovibrio sp.]|jgi:tetratricopeptide (TPR) repeat protein|nr:tetratricopeptide repeat protein [Desulfovibrio sp.]
MNPGRGVASYFIMFPLLLALAAMLVFSVKDIADGEKPAPEARRGDANTKGEAPENRMAPAPEMAGMPELTDARAEEVGELMRSLRENPNDPDTLGKIAEIFISGADWVRAEIFLNRSILSRPGDPRPKRLLGMVLHRQGRNAEAAKLLEEALKNHTDPDTLYNLAIIYKYSLDNRSRAEELLNVLAGLPQADPNLKEKGRKELDTP